MRLYRWAFGGKLFVLFLGVALFGIALAGIADRAAHWRGTVPAVLALLLGTFLIAVSLRGFHTVRILPFRNLSGGAERDKMEQVAVGFAELLDLELRRIRDLVTQEPFHQPADVLNPASGRGKTIQVTLSRVPFRTGVAVAGLGAEIKPTEVGTVALGPFKLQVGAVITLFARILGQAMRGSLVQNRGMLVVVASRSGGRNQSWTEQTPIDGDLCRAGAVLARKLAHRIQLEQPKGHAVGADVHSFEMLVDGLECYDHFLHKGDLQYLDRAEQHFRAALVHSPQYAAAYHNLGTVKSEQDRVGAAIGLPVSTVTENAATRLWWQAIDLDPDLAPARFQLTRTYLDRAADKKTDSGDRDLLLAQAVQSALATEVGADHSTEGALAAYWLGLSLLRQAHNRAVRRGRGRRRQVLTEVSLANRLLRHAMQYLYDERARRLVAGNEQSSVRPLADRIASVYLEQAACERELARLRSGPSQKWHRAKAERHQQAALKWGANTGEIEAKIGKLIEDSAQDPGYQDKALDRYISALTMDPRQSDALKAMARLTSDLEWIGGFRTDAITVAAHRNPDDPEPWLMLSRALQLEGDTVGALGLAGIALTQHPKGTDLHQSMNVLFKALESSPPARPGSRAAAPGTAYYAYLPDLSHADLLAAPDPSWDRRPRERWVRAWARANTATLDLNRSTSRERLEAAITEIEYLLDTWSAELPELRFVSRQLGLLHLALATAHSASDAERRHLARAAACLGEAVDTELPGNVPMPLLWQVEHAEVQASLGDSQQSVEHQQAADLLHQGAIDTYTQALERQPVRMTIRTDFEVIELAGDPPHLPAHARAFAGRGQVYAAQGRAADALPDCLDALRLAPLYAYPRFTLAGLYRELSQYELAEQHLRRLVDLLQAGSERDRARCELAYTYRQQAETRSGKERQQLLEKALHELTTITREPGPHRAFDPGVQEETAEILHLLGRTKAAIVALRAALAADRGGVGEARRLDRLAELLTEEECPDAVLQALEEARTACTKELTRNVGTDDERQLRSRRVMVTMRQAAYLAEQGIRLDHAQRLANDELRRAQHARLDAGQLADCEDTCGWIAYRRGRFDEAIPHFEAALDRSGGNATEWAHLALSLEARAAGANGTRHNRHRHEDDLNRARDIWQQIVDKFPNGLVAATTAGQHLQRLPERPHPPMPLVANPLITPSPSAPP
ncbi:tetratricopeptide repeat protein [Kitasatospora azatica]|uniref:hypothetical protein n=1 Tax=Kitasatospora azatica TaxID=58347 RepID=UPI0012FBD29B|nr:hypothetical protein [Kitasatospora azatica]